MAYSISSHNAMLQNIPADELQVYRMTVVLVNMYFPIRLGRHVNGLNGSKMVLKQSMS